VSVLPRILVYGGPCQQADMLTAALKGAYAPIRAESMGEALQLLRGGGFQGILLLNDPKVTLSDAPLFPQLGGVLSHVPEGMAILDVRLKILWTNPQLEQLTGAKTSLVGSNFFDSFGTPEILGPDLSPFHTALGSGAPSHTRLRLSEKSYFEVSATPVTSPDSPVPEYLVVTVRDVSEEVLLQQKLNAIFKAGLELGDIAPDELTEMTVSDRIELVKARIIQNTQDLLEYETVEIRLLNRETQRLEPLLNFGLLPEAAGRELFARAAGNGVTGFVAATGKSYLCDNTSDDPLYLVGAAGARSSLTVPLVLHDQILGTFNVESTRPGAFSNNDLQFLELFSREVAVALNTLNLLATEKIVAVTESAEAILRYVANPVDEILNDTTWILERFIGHDPLVGDRLLKILKHTREIRSQIHHLSDTAAQGANSAVPLRVQRPKLKGKRALVVDNDEVVRSTAHELLGRHGCVVETAHDGKEAVMMVRSSNYDVVLIDIRLPDLNGYECFCQLREVCEHLPVILMTGFGYDAGHSIVKCRQAGLKSVLFKPFRVEQLLDEVEKNLNPLGATIVNQGETAGTTVTPPATHTTAP
jgi:two-component system, sensor histidine kinase SagS